MPNGLTTASAEFRINTLNSGQQFLGGLTYIAGADVFGVAYTTFADPSGRSDIMYREIMPGGGFAASETVAVTGTDYTWAGDLIQLAGGDLALIWTDGTTALGTSLVRGIIADTDGTGQSADFSAGPVTLMSLAGVATGSADVAALSNGGFAVGVRGQINSSPADQGLIRVFAADGMAISAVDQVVDGADRSDFLGLAQQIDGRIMTLVQTSDDNDPDDDLILSQAYTTTGLASGGATSLSDPDPDVYAVYANTLTTLANGLVLEAYTAATFTGGNADNYDIRGRLLAPNGEVFSDFGVLSDRPSEDGHFQQVAATPDGGFVMVWRTGDDGTDPGFADDSRIVIRRFDVDGTPLGASINVTEGLTAALDFPKVAVSPAGEVLVSWTGDTNNALTDEDIFARAFSLDALGTPGVTRNGTTGNDRLTGTADDDTLLGGDGADVLDGGTGHDLMQGGLGNDFYFVDSLGDTISGEIAFSAGGGIDTVRAFVDYVQPDNIELVRLGNIDDSDRLNAIGNDAPGTLVGNAGGNLLIGRGGDDQINGNGGWDRLIGNTGRDTLVGGAGRDTFIYNSISESRTGVANRDVINGFDRGADRIDLSAIDANLGLPGDTFSFIGTGRFTGTAGELRLQNLGGPNAVLVEGDVRGDGVADFQIFVNLTTVLGAGDFIL